MKNLENHEHAKLENGKIVWAPACITDGKIVISNPTDAQYLEYGWKKYLENKPEEPAEEGKTWTFDSYVETETEIRKTWKQVDKPEEVIAYSKYKIILACMKRDKWTAVKNFIREEGVEDVWNACQCLSTDDLTFQTWAHEIVTHGVLTETELKEILEESVDR